MSAAVHAWTHGTKGLVLAYVVVQAPLIAGLIRGGAPLRTVVASPLVALPLLIALGLFFAFFSPVITRLGVPNDSWAELAIDVALCAVVAYAIGRWLTRLPGARTSYYRRGAVVASVAAFSEATRDGHKRRDVASRPPGAAAPLTLAGVPIGADDETKHFKIVGTTGTGKSTAIRELLSAALNRGDRAVIADPDGGYLARFYDRERGDVILNPFEPDSANWSLLSEIVQDYDVDQLARSLITDNGDPDRTWSEYARTFFIAIVQQLRRAGIAEDAQVYRLLAKAPVSELRELLPGTAAGPFLEEGNERMFGSIRSTASSAVRVLEYTTRRQGTAFSIRQWVKHGAAAAAGGRGGVLFLPYKAGEIAALRSIISAWMRIAIFEAMNRPEGDQRLWFVVDELDALGEIDGLKDALARLRKFGGRCILGFQSIAQVSGIYGRSIADTIVENCGNTLILRCSASERGGTSEFASKLIGQQQVVHQTSSQSRKSSGWGTSTTTSEHLSIEPAVMPSEFERLADLEGFLKLASIPDWTRVRLTPVSYPEVLRDRSGGVSNASPTGADQPVTHGN